VDVDLGRSRLWLPMSLLPGAAALPDVAVAPRITAVEPATDAAAAGDRWSNFR
jgi:hypothetical protein